MPGWLFIRTGLFNLFILFALVVVPARLERGRPLYLMNPIEIQMKKGTPAYRAFELVSSEKTQTESDSTGKVINTETYRTFNLVPLSAGQDVYNLANLRIQAEELPKQNQQSGQIEISGGLAVTHENQIFIERYQSGDLKERIPIDPKLGVYNINKGASEEQWMAKLINTKTGEALGEAKIHNDEKLVQIVPFDHRYVGSVSFDEYSLGLVDSTAFTEATTKKKKESRKLKQHSSYASPSTVNPEEPMTSVRGVNQDQQIPDIKDFEKGGQYTYEVTGPDGIKTMALLPSGDHGEFKIPTLTHKNVQTLLDIIQSQARKTLNTKYITIGSVRNKLGSGAAGAQLTVESDLRAKIFYFNDFFIPDVSLKETTSNGMFLILGDLSGYHSILAQHGELYYGFSNYVSAEGRISFVELEAGAQQASSSVEVVDFFKKEKLNSKLEIQGLSQEIYFQGQIKTIEISGANKSGLIYTSPENSNYVPTKSIYFEHQKAIRVPALNAKWIEKIQEKIQEQVQESSGEDLQDVPSNSLIIGFVGLDNYEVYVPESDKRATTILYFNREGHFLSANRGLGGGGFVVVTNKKGVQSLFLYNSETKKFVPQLVPTDGQDITTLNYDL